MALTGIIAIIVLFGMIGLLLFSEIKTKREQPTEIKETSMSGTLTMHNKIDFGSGYFNSSFRTESLNYKGNKDENGIIAPARNPQEITIHKNIKYPNLFFISLQSGAVDEPNILIEIDEQTKANILKFITD